MVGALGPGLIFIIVDIQKMMIPVRVLNTYLPTHSTQLEKKEHLTSGIIDCTCFKTQPLLFGKHALL